LASLFISYSRKDIDTARKLTQSFHDQGLDFWIDWEGIPPTVDWWKEIAKGIEEADIFLFLISPDSARSKVCGQEIEHAQKNGKRLIPVVVHDIKADESPAALRPLNWIFLRENDEFEVGLNKLITAIQTDYEWTQAHRQLQVKALEWERNNHENGFLLHGEELQDAEIQLVANSSKEPHPTDLQRDYVLKSRQIADRQRRRTTIATSVAAIIMAALAVFGFVQARLAINRATISRARELAAQSVSVRDSQFDLSLLLSIEALRTADIPRTRSVLLDNILTSPQLLQYFRADPDSSWSVAFSPDGKPLASSSEGTILLWDVATLQPIGQPLSGGVVAFSPDGKTLASTGSDNTIILWNVETHEPIGQPLNGHTYPIQTLAFSPDGKTLASGAFDSTVILWDVETHQPIGQPLEGRKIMTTSNVAFSPDGKMLASVSEGQNILLWDVETHEPLGQPLNGHTESINSLAFSPDGKTLASGSDDDRIILWDVATHLPIDPPLRGHAYSVNCLAFSPDGKTLVSGGNDNTIILWDMGSRPPIGQPLAGHTDPVQSVAFSPDGKTLASGADEILLWDVTRLQPLGLPLTGHTDPVQNVAFRPNGKTLVSSSSDVITLLWDVDTLKPIGEPLVGHVLALSPDGKTLASLGVESAVLLWDVETLQQIGQLSISETDSAISLAFSPDSKKLAIGGYDGIVSVWSLETRQPIGQPLTGHTGPVWSVAFSPDGKMLASGSEDKTILLWDVGTHRPIGQSLIGNTFPVTNVVFSPDAKCLFQAATGSCCGTCHPISPAVVRSQELSRPSARMVKRLPLVLAIPSGCGMWRLISRSVHRLQGIPVR
jgi:WD40 repeat protein